MIKRLLLSAACAAAMMTHAHAAQAPRPGNLDSRVTSVVYQSN
ncbi:conjugal transfer protein TrbG, partial [Sinorhizobium meliloti]